MHPRLSSMICLLLGALPAGLGAATLDLGPSGAHGTGFLGQPVAQSFRPDGSSVLRMTDSLACLVSARIDVANSRYTARDGSPVGFDDVIRSPASTVQMVAGQDGMSGIRVQLKYTLAPDHPVLMRLGMAEPVILPVTLREPSGDSLWIEGDLAATLNAAFARGESVTLAAVSKDTGRLVEDLLPAPDQGALAECLADLPQIAALPHSLPEPQHLHELVFDARRDPAFVASPEDMRACGQEPLAETLYLGRLRSVTGFVSHTDRIFVAYDADGQVSQAWIPGIFETALRGSAGQARISRAADANIPMTENRTSGCIGMRTTEICSYPGPDGGTRFGPCLPEAPLLGLGPVLPGGGTGGGLAGSPSGLIAARAGTGGGGGIGGGLGGGGGLPGTPGTILAALPPAQPASPLQPGSPPAAGGPTESALFPPTDETHPIWHAPYPPLVLVRDDPATGPGTGPGMGPGTSPGTGPGGTPFVPPLPSPPIAPPLLPIPLPLPGLLLLSALGALVWARRRV